jgi:methionyl-tRNA synthetase
MTKKKHFSLTTTLPYVNADPHIGFALEIVHADIIARYKRLVGYEVFFNTGTDEHGLKIYTKSQDAGKDAQAYVDEYALKFDELKSALNLSYNSFIRTTAEFHKRAAQEFWKRCDANGDIYKKNYKIKYCIGCELEKTDSELVDGKCPLHPMQDLEIIEEENYFFRFSKYQQPIMDLYEKRPDFVVPDFRFNEIKVFVERGLEDFSISRLKEKMPWGVAVPGDDTQVMYVWFDALVNYISALGWPDEKYREWWPSIQLAGKDNLRQQSAMWQAMLMSAGVEPSRQILIHGFFTVDGYKMSKSVGNVISPLELVAEYGTDAVRYYLARHAHPYEDTDFSKERFKEVYNANLANGLGNVVARVMKMAEDNLSVAVSVPDNTFPQECLDALEKFEIQKAVDMMWDKIGAIDEKITIAEPYKLVKTNPERAGNIMTELVVELYTVARMLSPLLPDTSEKIKKAVKENKKPDTLFPRK